MRGKSTPTPKPPGSRPISFQRANESFDAVFSYGVLNYTDRPGDSFRELIRVLKKGGLLGIFVSNREGGALGFLYNAVRWICRITGEPGTRLIANALVPFLGFLPTQSKVSLANASWRHCREVAQVNITPDKRFFFRRSDISDWFEEYQLETIVEFEDSPLTFWGIKRT